MLEMNVIKIPLKKIKLDKNHRAEVGDVSGLMDSIQQYGLFNPVTVIEMDKGKYELVAGYRRYEATRKIGALDINCNVINADEDDKDYINLIENIQRENTTPFEHGMAIKKLIDKGYSIPEVAKRIGVSRAYVNNCVMIIDFVPKKFKGKIAKDGINTKKGEISLSTAKAIENVSKTNKYTVKQKEELYALAFKGQLNSNNLKGIGRAIRRGRMTATKFVQEKNNIAYLKVDIPVKKNELEKYLKKTGTRNGAEFVRKVFREGIKVKLTEI
jgi:ParB/RepB/Spo0J family partition protein